MINRRMAENFLNDAKVIFEEAQLALRAGRYHRAVRLSQESFELAAKACLRAVGIEYPKAHEVSEALLENRERFPGWFKETLEQLAESSVWLAAKRGLSMYGNEVSGAPASSLFTPDDAERAANYARQGTVLAEKLLRELFG